MSKARVIVKKGEGESLGVLGTGLRFLCDGEKTDHAWSLMEVEVPESAGAPPHRHPWDEAYYILDGRLRFVVDGTEQDLSTGDFVYVPSGTLHGFRGISARPARTLIFDAPAHAESFFRELDREVKDLPRDLAKLPQIAERHQIHIAESAA